MNLDDLLESERQRPGFSTAQRAAIWRGVASSTGAAGALGAATEAATHSATAAPDASLVTLTKWKLGVWLAVVALGSAGAGAALSTHLAEPKITYVEAPAVATPPAPAASPEPVAPKIVASPAVSAAPPIAKAKKTPASRGAMEAHGAPPKPKDPALARERTLIDMARTALSRGDATSALSALDTHAREFPRSQLAPEREVLAIQALAARGRMGDARRRAASFRTQYPTSPLRPIVDKATR